MPYITNSRSTKFRLLISGLTNSGKTTSLSTFIYGPYDYLTQPDEATNYAGDKHMVILVCPGEYGIRSLPTQTPYITSIYYETTPDDTVNTVDWSKDAIDSFKVIYNQTAKNKPDILFLDGVHQLWRHIMNVNTNGDYLQGVDLNINPDTGRQVQYRAASLYNRTHAVFSDYISSLYACSIPFTGATTWEEWESGVTDSQRTGDISATRYLWPAIPGMMAKALPGMFDARLSARLEKRCLHVDCEDALAQQYHYVWQFLPKNDVMGVGIKGLKPTKSMKDTPWIHQNYTHLQALMQ